VYDGIRTRKMIVNVIFISRFARELAKRSRPGPEAVAPSHPTVTTEPHVMTFALRPRTTYRRCRTLAQEAARGRFARLALSAVLAAGCGGADDAGGPPVEAGEPVYVMTSNVWGPEGATGYLYSVSSLAEGEPSLERAIELPGGAWLTGRDGHRYVYVSSGDGGPTITRWEVLENGEFVEGPTISFAGLGLTMGMRFGTAPMASDTKAYLVDFEEHRIATWNPREMSVGSVIELDVEPRDGLPASIPTVVVHGSRLLVTVVWEDEWRFADSSRVIAIDTATDEIVGTSDDTRCEQLAISSVASTGTTYYSPYAHAPVARSLLGDEYGTRSCALRVVPPGAAFDDGWDVDLGQLAGGRPAGEFVLASDDVGFFRAFYNEEVGATAENWQDKQGVPGYRWWRWEIGADEAEEIPGQSLTVEAAHYEVDAKTYVGNPSDDWSSTSIVELDAAGALRDGITVEGTPGGVVRAR
jgi:hypothetical protein